MAARRATHGWSVHPVPRHKRLAICADARPAECWACPRSPVVETTILPVRVGRSSMATCTLAQLLSVQVCQSTLIGGVAVRLLSGIRSRPVPGWHREKTNWRALPLRSAWRRLLQRMPPADEYRGDRAARTHIAPARERGERLPSELPSSIMRCVCGEKFDRHRPEESLPHRWHIYAAQAAKESRDENKVCPALSTR